MRFGAVKVLALLLAALLLMASSSICLASSSACPCCGDSGDCSMGAAPSSDSASQVKSIEPPCFDYCFVRLPEVKGTSNVDLNGEAAIIQNYLSFDPLIHPAHAPPLA